MSIQKKLNNLMGPMPDPCKLNSHRSNIAQYDSYSLERVIYNVEENDHGIAYLLIPHKIKYPGTAIFCHHQHAGNWALGKSEPAGLKGDPDQFLAKELAELGFVTFAPDALGFEERNKSEDKSHDHAYWEMTTRILQGKTMFAKLIHDIKMGIEFLMEDPDLGIEKIGFIGHSYGGKMALLAPFFDRRIQATVSNCGCISWGDSMQWEAGIQMELCIPDIVNHLDLKDIVKRLDPCSVLISATRDDVWSMSAENIYQACNSSFYSGSLQLNLYEGGHVFSEEMRKQAYDFLSMKLS